MPRSTTRQGVPDLQDILKYLKNRGEQLDTEIAAATGLSVENVRQRVNKLSATGEVIVCQSIRFDNGKKKEQMLCRIAGYVPPAAPGRKPKAQSKAQV
jgi:predicted ArsR family transcriptional regulator